MAERPGFLLVEDKVPQHGRVQCHVLDHYGVRHVQQVFQFRTEMKYKCMLYFGRELRHGLWWHISLK